MLRISGLIIILSSTLFAHSNKYDIEIRQAPIQDVIRFLAKVSHKGVVVPEKLESKVTASFMHTSPNKALNTILKTNELGAIEREKVLQIVTKQKFEALGSDLITETLQLKFGKAGNILKQLEPLISSRGSLLMDSRTNFLTVRETKEKLDKIKVLINQLDVPAKQVKIEARIVEVTKKFARNMGIQWGVNYDDGFAKVGGLGAIGEAAKTLHVDAGPGSGTPNSGIGFSVGPLGGVSLDVQLAAGEENNDAKVLSRPSIVTMNNEAATIRSGLSYFVKAPGNVSFSSGGSETAETGSNIQEISTGITMVVTPQVTTGDKVKLDINVSTSQPVRAFTVDGIPGVSESSSSTQVLLKNGETTVISGLITDSKSNTQQGMPWLSKIPIIGYLFGNKGKSHDQTELMIFITPTIIEG